MKVLIVGSGGREHALAWRIGRSPELTSLWVAGGNAGTAQIAKNLPINERLQQNARQNGGRRCSPPGGFQLNNFFQY